MNYFPWWLVENHQIETKILSHLQILMKITVSKGQSKKNQTEDEKIIYLDDHHVVRKKDNFSDCLHNIPKSFVEKDPTDTLQRKMNRLDGMECK